MAAFLNIVHVDAAEGGGDAKLKRDDGKIDHALRVGFGLGLGLRFGFGVDVRVRVRVRGLIGSGLEFWVRYPDELRGAHGAQLWCNRWGYGYGWGWG